LSQLTYFERWFAFDAEIVRPAKSARKGSIPNCFTTVIFVMYNQTDVHACFFYKIVALPVKKKDRAMRGLSSVILNYRRETDFTSNDRWVVVTSPASSATLNVTV
jgi:hypothetical protein